MALLFLHTAAINGLAIGTHTGAINGLAIGTHTGAIKWPC